MWAVMFGNLECLKEMEKLQGTNFRIKNQFGEGLLDVARKRLVRKKYRKEERLSVLCYLLHRSKVESLKELAAHAVACHLSCDTDVEKLDVPLILRPWVAGFLQTSTVMNIDRWSETSDEEEDLWVSSDAADEDEEEEDEEDDLWNILG